MGKHNQVPEQQPRRGASSAAHRVPWPPRSGAEQGGGHPMALVRDFFFYVSYNLNSLKGVIWGNIYGTAVGVIRGILGV